MYKIFDGLVDKNHPPLIILYIFMFLCLRRAVGRKNVEAKFWTQVKEDFL